MKPLAFAGSALLLLLLAGAATAQAQVSPYDCQNVAVRVSIHAQAMATALDRLTQQTRCPISREVDVSTLRSTAVRGRMRPDEALVAMVRGSGLEARPVRQGLMVDRADQQAIAARADALDRRIAESRQAGGLTPPQAAALRRSLDRVRDQATTLARRQGFVSAAERASFQRSFDEVEAALRG